jgi:hypothetical protein
MPIQCTSNLQPIRFISGLPFKSFHRQLSPALYFVYGVDVVLSVGSLTIVVCSRVANLSLFFPFILQHGEWWGRGREPRSRPVEAEFSLPGKRDVFKTIDMH